jgi:protein-disulfide isomerase
MVSVMRAFIISILAFSLAGAAVSCLLLYQHYVPQTEFGMFACGSELVNPCRILARSGFDTILGLPVAGLGVLAYLFMIVAIVVTMISGETRYPLCFAVLLPVTALSVITDIILGSVLIHLGLACRLCMVTYALNILTCVSLFLWYLRMADDHEGFRVLYRDLAVFLRGNENRPLVASFSFIMLFMFLFIVFFTAYMDIRVEEDASSQARISRFKEYFNARPQENISLPESTMSIGAPDAEIRIIVFTDFLCSACHRFYEVEKSLLSRFWHHIRIDYYCFPLDNVCNMHAPETTYPNSCVAAQAFIMAAQRGMFRELLEYHYEHYRDYVAVFNRGDALASLRDYFKTASRGTYDDFVQAALSERVKLMLNEDVERGGGLAVKAVPTLFINGRRLEGVPDAALLEAVLSDQLEIRRQ